MNKIFQLLVAVSIWLLLSCDGDLSTHTSSLHLPEEVFQYPVTGEANLPTLGRVLFYDKQLSINNSTSCASCHKQNLGFADDVPFSRGFENRMTARNTMAIQGLGRQLPGFLVKWRSLDEQGNVIHTTDSSVIPFFTNEVLFWDGRESNLNALVLQPLVDHFEMGMQDMDALVQKLYTIPYYHELFTRAYGDSEITSEKIGIAIRSFIVNIRADNTKFNKVVAGEASFGALEVVGHNLFIGKYNCNSCHNLFATAGYESFDLESGAFSNIGLDEIYADQGREKVTGNASDAGKFRIPSLKNIALTAPYMHDGRFKTLEEVIDHYSIGMRANPNLDHRLRDEFGNPLTMNISSHEKKALVAFLNTLTDYQMMTDPRFSNPFK